MWNAETVDFLLSHVERMVVRPCLEDAENDFAQVRAAHDALCAERDRIKQSLPSSLPETGFWKISNLR